MSELTQAELQQLANKAWGRTGRSAPSRVYSIRVPAGRSEQVQRLAEARGVAPSVMLGLWALERLDRETVGPVGCGTSGGVELSDAVVEGLADEAEAGYDVERLRPRRVPRTAPLPCLVCGQELESVDAGPQSKPLWPGSSQPHGATTFHSYGQYGSTAFDPQDESQIEINVCDGCLVDRADRVWHSRHVRRPALTLMSQPWVPDVAGG